MNRQDLCFGRGPVHFEELADKSTLPEGMDKARKTGRSALSFTTEPIPDINLPGSITAAEIIEIARDAHLD